MGSIHDDGLPRATPESAGYSSKHIQAFLEDAATSGVELHSFMLFAKSQIITEAFWWPYRADLPHMMHSATKNFLSVAVGLAIQEGYFQLDSPVVSFFPNRVPKNASRNLLSMTVEDLLTQTSGHGYGVSGGEWRSVQSSWVDSFFSIPVDNEPGTAFAYSSATSYMLSAIISETTGQSVAQFLEPRFFRHLGITMCRWDVGPDGVNPGGNGLTCRTSDFLKLGILHLQEGVWEGRQILPKEWVQQATKAQRGNEYGYHWRAHTNGIYWASGIFGQFVIVFPESGAVLATTAAVGSGATPLHELIDRHFPAFFTKPQEPTDTSSELRTYTSSLRVLSEFPTSGIADPVRSAISRTISKETFFAATNQDSVFSFALDFSKKSDGVLQLHDSKGFHQVRIGLTGWVESYTSLSGGKLHHSYELPQLRYMASGYCLSDHEFRIVLHFHETTFCDTIEISFSQDYGMAKLERSVNVNSFGTRRPTVFAARLIKGEELSSDKFRSF